MPPAPRPITGPLFWLWLLLGRWSVGHPGPSHYEAGSSRRSASSSRRPGNLRTNQFQSLATRHLHREGDAYIAAITLLLESPERVSIALWTRATRLEKGTLQA